MLHREKDVSVFSASPIVLPARGMEGHKDLIREERTESGQLTLPSQRDIPNHVPLCGKKGRKKGEFIVHLAIAWELAGHRLVDGEQLVVHCFL